MVGCLKITWFCPIVRGRHYGGNLLDNDFHDDVYADIHLGVFAAGGHLVSLGQKSADGRALFRFSSRRRLVSKGSHEPLGGQTGTAQGSAAAGSRRRDLLLLAGFQASGGSAS